LSIGACHIVRVAPNQCDDLYIGIGTGEAEF
jgi:hypothetical protein